MSTPVYMHTLGCPKNRVDSEIMLGTLSQAGYRLVQDPARADVIVVNTCGFIESAKEESVQAILELGRMKEEGRCKKLVVAGCLTQRYPEEMAREMPEVDHFVGTGAYADIASIVSDAQARRVIVPDPDFVHSATTPRVNSLARHTAYLKIAEGCDNACAFCIIPALRGAQRSRTVDDVVAEAEALAAQGVVELSLVAQDLTAYGHDLPGKVRLHHLLPELCRVEGIRWIRLHYAYPRDFPDALVEVIAREPKIAKYVDMPLQHSSDRLLRSMKRGRDVKFLRALLAQAARPGPRHRPAHRAHRGAARRDRGGLRGPASASCASSASSGWASSPTRRRRARPRRRCPGQIPERVKKARQQKIMAIQQRISRAEQRALVGQRLEVLVEGKAEGTDHLLVGRHARQAPEIDGVTYINAFAIPGEKVAYPGEIVTVEITDAGDYDLVGTVVAREARRAGRRLPAATAGAREAHPPARDPVTLAHVVRRPSVPADRPPMVVLLHGLGADEQDLFGLAPWLDPRLLVVSARAPHEAQPMGYSWFDIDFERVPAAHRLPARGREPGRHPPLRRGGGARPTAPTPRASGSWGSARGPPWRRPARLARPELLRGIVAHSGRITRRAVPTLAAPALAGFPVLWQHGRADPVVPVAFGHEAREVLGGLGMRVDYREYPIGHEISEESLRDLCGWLARQVDGASQVDAAAGG